MAKMTNKSMAFGTSKMSQRDIMAQSLAHERNFKIFGSATNKGMKNPPKMNKMTPAQIQKRKRTTLSNAATKMFSQYSR